MIDFTFITMTSRMQQQPTSGGLEPVLLEHLPALFLASQSGPHASLVAIRRLLTAARAVEPKLADALSRRMSDLTSVDATRRLPSASAPAPTEVPMASPVFTSSAPFTRVDCSTATEPILPARAAQQLHELVEEHERSAQLEAAGLRPRSMVMLVGPPGVGKTMLAAWFARRMGVSLAQIQLSHAFSSLLGQTGSNLKDAIDWARREKMVLLFDEFDALAKRRDDATDLGELKRVVSVLLKELEEWAGPSIIIAATNHPDLIDPAIFRRFDLTITLEAPDRTVTEAILRHHLAGTISDDAAIAFAADLLQKTSGSFIRLFAERVRRDLVLKSHDVPAEALLNHLGSSVKSKDDRVRYARRYKDLFKRATLSAIAERLDVSTTTIHRDLKDEGVIDG